MNENKKITERESELIDFIRSRVSGGEVVVKIRKGEPVRIAQVINNQPVDTFEDFIKEIQGRFKWGDITVKMRNGKPYMIERALEYRDI